MAKRRTRVQPSEKCGYGPGRFVAQYYDPAMKVWFDIGDPVNTRAEARAKSEGGDALIEVTHMWCPQSGGLDGEDNATHHLVPRGRSQTCSQCGRTEKQIRDSIAWFINEDGVVYDYDRVTQPLVFPGDFPTAYATKAAAQAVADAL